MPLYHRTLDASPISRAGGTSAESVEAGSHLTENLLSAGGFKPTASDHQSAIQSFRNALTGETGISIPRELPPLEVAQNIAAPGDAAALDNLNMPLSEISGSINGLMKSVMDVAMKLADPFGFISAVCEFLIGLFVNVSSEFAQVLPQFDLYNQAAQAALDTEKMLGQ